MPAPRFQQGNVDAWAIWDPYYSAALLQGGVRVLKDGTDLNQTDRFIWQLVRMQKKTALLFRVC